MDTPDPWAPDIPPHSFTPDPSLPAACVYRPTPGAAPCGYGRAHAIHPPVTVQERAARGEVDAMARMDVLAQLEDIPLGDDPERCSGSGCPWTGIWGATGVMPPGHHMFQAGARSWYLAHDITGQWPDVPEGGRSPADRYNEMALGGDPDDRDGSYDYAADRVRTVRETYRPHRFDPGRHGSCQVCGAEGDRPWHAVGGILSRAGVEPPRPLPGPAIPRGVIAPVVAGVIIGSAVGLSVAGMAWDSYRSWVAGRQVRRLIREAQDR